MKLFIENIKIANVEDMGYVLDAQDPCVSIRLGSHYVETERYD